MARFHREPMTLLPAALYTLIDLSSEDLLQAQQACESECVATGNEANSSVRIAPQPAFVGRPLQAVFDYHIELSSQEPLEFDPRHFIAITNEDWQTKGVLLVTLDDDGLECNVDSFTASAADAGLSVVNILVGNSDWSEQKENYELQAVPDEGDDNDDDDDRRGSGRNRDGGVENTHASDSDSNEDLGGPPAPKEEPLSGFNVPVYIHSQLQPDEVIAQIEPAFHLKTKESYLCRIQASLTPGSTSSQDLVAQAVALHPLRCAKNKWLHQTMLIVVDTADPVENGMIMCHLEWEGLPATAGTLPHPKTALTEMGATLARSITPNSTMRIRYSVSYGLQEPFMTLALGAEAWPDEAARKMPKFGVFQYNTSGNYIGFGNSLLYSRVPQKQVYTQEQLVYDQELEIREEFNGGAEDLDDAVRRFPMFCRENRFVENLDTTFFICIDREDIAEAGVVLARRRWDGNVWGRPNRELMALEIANVCSTRVPAQDAIDILIRGREGNIEGMAPDLVNLFS